MFLLIVIHQGFLRGAPHLTKKAVAKYLSPIMALSKDHMKRLHKGICSTTSKQPCTGVLASVPDPVMPSLIKPYDPNSNNDISDTAPCYNIINDIEDQSIANIFCFSTFTDKVSGVVYNDCTGEFPYMSLGGNVCFFVMYHYKTNAILVTPISGLNSASVLDAYKKIFE